MIPFSFHVIKTTTTTLFKGFQAGFSNETNGEGNKIKCLLGDTGKETISSRNC